MNITMKNLKLITAMAIAAFSFTACEKDNSDPAPTVKSEVVNNLPGDPILGLNEQGIPYGSGKFTFYSLENGQMVPNTDSATTQWDLGFRGTTIITNSGNMGPGNGGAYVHVGTFDDLKGVSSDSTFRTENAPSNYAIRTGSGNGWYNYNGASAIVTPIPGRVLVVRTANGNYAKVEILSYYKDSREPSATASDDEKLNNQRYYNFRYSVQKNGSMMFE